MTRGGQPVRFTKAEWKILVLLVNEPGGLVTHGRLLEELGRPADSEVTSLRVHLNHIRRNGRRGTILPIQPLQPPIGFRAWPAGRRFPRQLLYAAPQAR